ncbi:MAG: hypothetical protein QNJ44_05525 [Rhodobacter sp.]|nr:hypothetical protein [Rhodobacter sp.]
MNELVTDFFPAITGVEDRLRKAEVRYVVVAQRHVSGGDHVALLVADKDAARAKAAIRGTPGVSVHFFTLAGAKSGGFRLDNPKYNAITLAIFPLELADHLLESAMRAGGLDALDDFRIAAYVRAYFGGQARLFGLTAEDDEAVDLQVLAKAAGVDPFVCRNRASLDAFLAAAGWRPPIDMLERLGLADDWIRDTLLPILVDDAAVPPGLTVFFCRARTTDLARLDTMRSAIEDAGFEILLSLPLDGELATTVRRSVRGGNWGAGPWPKNGGPPVHLLFAADVFPVEPAEAIRAQHPFLDNNRILSAKIAARDAVLAGVPSGSHFNALHSADNSAETLRFAKLILAEDASAALEAEFLSRRAEVDAAIEEFNPLPGRNAVALMVRRGQGPESRMRKIFRRQYLDDMRHDAELLERLASDWPEFPSLRKRGPNYLEFDDVGADCIPLASLGTLAPIATILRLRKVLQAVAASGFDPVGWDPGHGILVSQANGVHRIPGFDRLQRRDDPVRVAEAARLTGPMHRDKGNYRVRWYPVLGIPRAVFFGGSPTVMHLYRMLVHPLHRGFGRVSAAVEAVKTYLRVPMRSIRRMARKGP